MDHLKLGRTFCKYSTCPNIFVSDLFINFRQRKDQGYAKRKCWGCLVICQIQPYKKVGSARTFATCLVCYHKFGDTFFFSVTSLTNLASNPSNHLCQKIICNSQILPMVAIVKMLAILTMEENQVGPLRLRSFVGFPTPLSFFMHTFFKLLNGMFF